MTNKIINVDVLDKLMEWLDNEIHKYIDVHGEDWDYGISYFDIKRKINELATETQETIDDDWNRDLSLLEDYDKPYLISNGCRIAWGEGFGDNVVYHPIGDFMAFDDEYFAQSVKMWKPL